jgi:hypothetical protein
VEVVPESYVNQHYIQVGSVVRAKDVRLMRVQIGFPFDPVKKKQRPENKVSPYFLDPEHHWKPFFPRE